MNNEYAAEAVRMTVERVVADGLRRESMTGASDQQIDAWAVQQGVSAIPQAVREILRLIGVRRSRWLAGSSFGVEMVGSDSKRFALATLRQVGDTLVDSAGMLVLVDHQSYSFYVIDGADLLRPDPPVWVITEGEPAEEGWSSVTGWFDDISPNVAEDRERLEIMHELGHWIDPAWSEYIDFS
ncbi:hypothetical protein ACFYO1_22910 [Nocardia sp. NPDC006044]|uniref:hypothetical protein n=1 Tax=Nocardia sp. NPDC006044 TaxID=3364306 RepID=UPI0036BDE772